MSSIRPTNASARVEAVKLRGDYWRDLPYPLGQHGNDLISTSNAGTGTLTSDEFLLDTNKHFFSFLLGGSSNASSERVELQVRSRSSADAAELQRQINEWRVHAKPTSNVSCEPKDGEYVGAICQTAQTGAERRDLERLQQKFSSCRRFCSRYVAGLKKPGYAGGQS
ncbi:MAG: hypothetical protein V7638_2486 [Acidobacteriota bacterium]